MSPPVAEAFVLEAATGRALPLMRGQVLRVEQIGDGQVLDLNAYSLADHKEHFHSGRTRGLHGIAPGVGDHLWSAPPRERVMLTIIADSVGTNDVNYSRCSAFLYEAHYGFNGEIQHCNCHDAFAEAIREWELTPDDVHDSFNAFMNTRLEDGRLRIDRNRAKAGDHIEFLAQMDCLVVVVCCGGDVGATNNYELKALKIAVRDGTSSEQRLLLDASFRNQRSVVDFALPRIKTDRALRRDPTYRPHWPWRQAVRTQHALRIRLTSKHRELLAKLRGTPRFADLCDADLMRFILFQWLERRHRRPIHAVLKELQARAEKGA